MTEQNVDAEDRTDAPAPPAGTEFFEEGTFNDWLGLRVDEYGGGQAVLSVEYEDFKQNPGNVLHGGVTATLIDVAGGIAIGSTFDGENPMMATTNLDIQYLRPITNDAEATAEVVRVGSSNAVARVEVESTAPEGDRKIVATGSVTYQRG